MDHNYLFLLIISSILCLHLSYAQFRKEAYQYAECQSGNQKRVGVQDGRIKDSAMKASSHKERREPSIGRLGDKSGAWSPSVQNAIQWLQIDLGESYIVTSVYIQGRQGSDEYVREFFLEYSDDEKTWRVYTNQLGIPEVFEGNNDDSTPQMRELIYPVVTRYVRFNPQRWNMVISMRVEIVGCKFTPQTASFDGESRIDFDMSQAAGRSDDKLEMRFKTAQPDGVIMYASGTQGDMIMLELKRGYLYFRIDLGSTTIQSGLTEVVAGSLLDDNQWHDVIIVRTRHKLTVVVDRLMNELTTNGLFYRLDLDKKLYLGGVPFFNLEGVTVKSNFWGCIQNVNFNGGLLVNDAMQKTIAGIDIVSNVARYCPSVAQIPVTFPSLSSYIKIIAKSGNTIQVSFDFRTYNEDALLVYHEIDDKKFIEISLDVSGFLFYKFTIGSDTVEDTIRNTNILAASTAFTDGLWHSFSLKADGSKINCTVDHNSKVSNRELDIKAGDTFYIGGYELLNGFKGCIRNLYVAQNVINLLDLLKNPENVVDATIGTCSIRDRCTPNPCEHGGKCTQTWNTFTCNCDGSGYKGELCHSSAYHISCEMHKQYSNIDGREDTWLDPDGSGPLEPYQAACERNDDGEILTYIGHDSMGQSRVTGFPEAGSFVKKITYNARDILALEEIIDRARSCRQNVVYRCQNAKFLDPTGLEENDKEVRTWGWWVGRTFQPMRYWGGAAPGSGKCSCGLDEQGCGYKSTTCHCDADLTGVAESQRVPQTDQGYLVHKEYLPVLELHLGDTDSSGNKWAEYNIGELECRGDNLFDNTVTFDKKDGLLEFATFEAESAGDIWFQFKTTASDGVLMHNTGAGVSDFLEIRLFQSDTIQFRYDVGNGVAVVTYKRPSPFNDDDWHTVHVEKNRKQAWMKIDDQKEVFRNEDADLIRRLDLSSPLTVGGLIGGQDGFVGCMRGLRVNGKLMDLQGSLRKGSVYGVKPGCVGKCASNPCFHQGTCREGYDRYTCDCSYTPWRGWNCGREVGVNMMEDYMIKYEFDETQGLSASDFQYAVIGFSTQVKKGILMQIRNEANTEYISVELNNNGGVKVVMDVGFTRVEENTDSQLNMDYAKGQAHVLVVRRFNYGKGLSFQVDNYPAKVHEFTNPSDTSDTILDNPKYLFIGNNDTKNTKQGFKGCIYRMQVDNIFPLKRAFQDPRPKYITMSPEKKMREDMCGYEEITVSPEPIQVRPNQGILQNVTYRRATEPPLSDEEKALVGVGCALFIILVACIVLFCCRSRLEGADYETEEAAGTEFADNPDSAVVYNQTGLPNMPKSYEYFM